MPHIQMTCLDRKLYCWPPRSRYNYQGPGSNIADRPDAESNDAPRPLWGIPGFNPGSHTLRCENELLGRKSKGYKEPSKAMEYNNRPMEIIILKEYDDNRTRNLIERTGSK